MKVVMEQCNAWVAIGNELAKAEDEARGDSQGKQKGEPRTPSEREAICNMK